MNVKYYADDEKEPPTRFEHLFPNELTRFLLKYAAFCVYGPWYIVWECVRSELWPSPDDEDARWERSWTYRMFPWKSGRMIVLLSLFHVWAPPLVLVTLVELFLRDVKRRVLEVAYFFGYFFGLVDKTPAKKAHAPKNRVGTEGDYRKHIFK